MNPEPFLADITFANALSKYQRDAVLLPSTLRSEIEISCLRNEVSGLQVQLSADQDFTLVIDRANWLHPAGFLPRVRLAVEFPTLSERAVEVFTVGYLQGDENQFWMDPLDSCGWVEVPAHQIQAVYIRLRIPKDIPPGDYSGNVIAYTQFGFEDEKVLWQGQVSLTIRLLTLPEPIDFSFHLNLWQHLTSLSRHHRAPLWSEAHFQLIDRYYASLSQLGQKAVTLVAAEIPWSGQRCYREPENSAYLFEHSVIPVSRTQAGTLHLDFSHLDRLIQMAAKYGMDREIDLFGLLNVWTDEEFGFGKAAPDAPDSIRIRCLDETLGTYTYLHTAAELRLFVRCLHDHLKEIGVLERVRVAADEPSDLDAFNASLAFIKEAAPDFHYNAAINHFEFIEKTPAEVLDFVPILTLVCREPDLTQNRIEHLHQRGGKMLWYVCCWPPIPNTFLRSLLIETRLIGWLTEKLGLDGFLRWAFCLWPSDPWKSVSWRPTSWPAGDLYFVMPGPDGAPVETLRYEALRMAVQDYELLRLAKRSLTNEQYQTVSQAAFAHILRTGSITDFAEIGAFEGKDLYSLDPQEYAHARDEVIKILEETR